MEMQNDTCDSPYNNIYEDKEGDNSYCGVGQKSELWRESSCELLRPLRSGEGKTSHFGYMQRKRNAKIPQAESDGDLWLRWGEGIII